MTAVVRRTIGRNRWVRAKEVDYLREDHMLYTGYDMFILLNQDVYEHLGKPSKIEVVMSDHLKIASK